MENSPITPADADHWHFESTLSDLEKCAKVGDALRGDISWRCSDSVDYLLRKGYI